MSMSEYGRLFAHVRVENMLPMSCSDENQSTLKVSKNVLAMKKLVTH